MRDKLGNSAGAVLQRGLSLWTVIGAAALIAVGLVLLVAARRPSNIGPGRQGCASNMRMVYQAAKLYSEDNGGGEDAPELQGFSYVYESNWVMALDQYANVYPQRHCPAAPGSLKESVTSYGFFLRDDGRSNMPAPTERLSRSWPEGTETRMTRMSLELGTAMPIVSCQVHDELENYYLDPPDLRARLDPFMHWIGADGKIRYQRANWTPRILMSNFAK